MTSHDDSLVFFGGPIHTLCDTRPTVEAVGVRGDRIVAVGSRREVEDALNTLNGRHPRPVDLSGAAMFPGFVDAHTHAANLGLRLSLVDLDDADSLDEALARVTAFAAGVAPGDWVHGGGWNKNLWGNGDFPSRNDLDRAAPGHPVALASKDGHCWWLNTEALRRVGITKDTVDPDGGEIVRDASGEATGILKENASMFIWATIEQPDAEAQAGFIRKAVDRARELGLVGLVDMEGPNSLRAFQSLDSTGELGFRVWLYLPEELAGALAETGVFGGFGSDYVKISGLKAFLDGALGSQTADMLEPFEGSESRGIETMTAEAFSQLVAKASKAHLPVAVHAIGDRACRKALDAFEAHRQIWQPLGLRHRIEHLQILDPADLPRVAELGVVASMQPIHAPSDRDIAERHLGPKRVATSYAWRSVADTGAVLAFGSDVPVETCDPLAGIFAAVTRRHPRHAGREPWHPEQAVSPADAAKAYTVGAAWSVSAENERGTIEPGKLADLTVVSDDFLGVPAEKAGETLLRAKAVATIVGGRFVYGHP